MAFRSLSFSAGSQPSCLGTDTAAQTSGLSPNTRTASSSRSGRLRRFTQFLPHSNRTSPQCSNSSTSNSFNRDDPSFSLRPFTRRYNSHNGSDSNASPVFLSNPSQSSGTAPTAAPAAVAANNILPPIEVTAPHQALCTTEIARPTAPETVPFAAAANTGAPSTEEDSSTSSDQISALSTTTSRRSSSEARARASSSASSRSTASGDLPCYDNRAMAPSIADGSATLNAQTASTTLGGLVPPTSSIVSARRSTDPAISPSLSGASNGITAASTKPEPKPTIRFFAYQDPHHSSRPSLPFTPMNRTLPSESSVIRVGRYSERDGVPVANPSGPSDAPIGFKSKVVSRRHCEFSFVDGQWHIKDVGSSSGTFLNRMRLSQPNMVSRLYAVRDGDIVQLGIDFRGGEEMIFRCVRIRIECNRSWQQRPNEFNKNTETLIQNLGKGDSVDYAGCRECSICLGSVLRPYQCLFMAACAHVWHYKCIRRLIHTPDYPMFQCPNCRAWTDLSAEVDDTVDYEEEPNKAEKVMPTPEKATPGPSNDQQTVAAEGEANSNERIAIHVAPPLDSADDTGLAAITEQMHLDQEDNPMQLSDSAESSEVPQDEPVLSLGGSARISIPARSIRRASLGAGQDGSTSRGTESLPNGGTFEDNPMTPRNDSGPLAFDGRAGRL